MSLSSIFSFKTLRARPRDLRAPLLAAALLLAGELALRGLTCAPSVEHPRIWPNQALGQKLAAADRLVAGQEGLDLLFFGNSRAEFDFNPRLAAAAGRRAFNFGMGGLSAKAQCLLVRELLVPRYRPGLLVWGLDPIDFNSAAPLVQHYNRRFFAAPACRALADQSPGGWLAWHVLRGSALFGYSANLHAYLDICLSSRDKRQADRLRRRYALQEHQLHRIWREGRFMPPQKYTFDDLGWHAGRQVFAGLTANHRRLYPQALQPFSLDEEWRAEFARTLAFCRARGVRILVVSFPSTAAYLSFAERPAEVGADFSRVLAATCRAAGVEFLDAAGAGGFPDQLFRDPNHLNAAGAGLLTGLVLDRLGLAGGELLAAREGS